MVVSALGAWFLGFRDYGLNLPAFGDMGNSLQSIFIFLTNTRYASRASVCVAYVLLRFIHIFRYLSELVSLRAAYHSRVDVCFRTMASRRPPNPVTPLTCLRQAALSSATSELSSDGSSAYEPIPMLEKIPEPVDFDGAAFGDGVFGDAIFGDAIFGDATFGDDGLEEDVLDEAVLDDEDFEDEDLEDELFDSGFDSVFEDANLEVAFGDGDFGDVAFSVAAFAGVDFTDASFGDLGFDGVEGDGSVFAEATFDGENLVVTIFEGTTFGAAAGGGATGSATGVATDWNWPLAICRARSFTLRNILTERWSTWTRERVGASTSFQLLPRCIPRRIGQHADMRGRPRAASERAEIRQTWPQEWQAAQ